MLTTRFLLLVLPSAYEVWIFALSPTPQIYPALSASNVSAGSNRANLCDSGPGVTVNILFVPSAGGELKAPAFEISDATKSSSPKGRPLFRTGGFVSEGLRLD